LSAILKKMNHHQFKMKTSTDLHERAHRLIDGQERKRVLHKAGLEIDYLSGRKENGRVYYNLYYNEDGNRIKCPGIVAFSDIP